MGQGEDTAQRIRQMGWTPLILHTVELRPGDKSEIFSQLSKALAEGPVDWLVFMSPNGVNLFFDVLLSHGNILPSVQGQFRILAVGPKTKHELSKHGLHDIFMPESFSSLGVADFLSGSHLQGKRVILARSSAANDSLARDLEAKGATVVTIRLYDSLIPADATSVFHFIDELEEYKVQTILFTSSVSASNLFTMSKDRVPPGNLARMLRTLPVGAIGPITAQKLRQLGIAPTIIPKRFVIDEALKELVSAYKTTVAPAETPG